MKVLCLAGAWCGDCSGQCPAFEHFAAAAPVIQVHYLDRDEHADVQKVLQINGGNRVPVVVFFSEDGFEVARYGERTLSKYRQLMAQAGGAACPTGILTPGDSGPAGAGHAGLAQRIRTRPVDSAPLVAIAATAQRLTMER